MANNMTGADGQGRHERKPSAGSFRRFLVVTGTAVALVAASSTGIRAQQAPAERRHPLADLAASVERTLNRPALTASLPEPEAPTLAADTSAAALYARVPPQARALKRLSAAAPDLAALPAGALPPAAPADPAPEPAEGDARDSESQRAVDRLRRSRVALYSAASGSAQAAASTRSMVSATDPGRFTPGNQDGGFGEILGDSFARTSEVNQILPGFSVDFVNLSTGVSSNGTPPQQARLTGLDLGADYDVGVSGSLSYQRDGRRSGFNLSYQPSHVQRGRFSEWSSTSHRLRLGLTRELSRRWNVSTHLSANDSAIEQFWFTLPVLRSVETDAQTIDDVFNLLDNGDLTEEEAASLFTGAPIVEQPGDQRLAVGRALGIRAGASASYAYSPRLTFIFSARANSNRLYNDPVPDDGRARLISRGRISRIGSQGVSGGLRYRLNARSDIGWQHGIQWFDSSFQQSQAQSSNVFFSQKLSRSWNYRVSTGLGVRNHLRTISLEDGTFNRYPGSRRTLNFGGSLGYSRESQAFSVSARRGIGGNELTLGQNRSTSLSASWQWNPLRSRWVINAGGAFFVTAIDRQVLTDVLTRQTTRVESSIVRGGVGRTLSPTTSVRTEYYFGRYVTPWRGLFSDIIIHRMQASLIWRPIFR